MLRLTASRSACLLSGALLAFAAFSASTALAAKQPVASPAPPPLLPASFGQWRQSGKPITSSDPRTADAANVASLREYGFQRFASAIYKDPAGDTLSLRADQFPDATGAYGAFTFYRHPGMVPEILGAGAASAGDTILFWQGNVLLNVQFAQQTDAQKSAPQLAKSISSAELRDQLQPLVAALPKPSGNASIFPPLPGYLPADGLRKGSERYSLGPAAYTASGGSLPPAVVGFDMGTEAITAQYSTRAGGNGTLTILNCPTTQLAVNRLGDIVQKQAAEIAAATAPSGAIWSGAFAARRSGTLVSIATGGFSPQVAQRLAESVHYQAGVTWNHPQGYMSDAYRAARLYLAIFALIGILGAAAVLLGLFLGGGRALVRVWQGKPASSMHDAEFISLNLRD